jgi:hypothetical protein
MRSAVERAARVVAIAALVWSAWSIGRRVSVTTNLRRALTDWTTASVRLALDSTPSPVERDWLAALRHSGVATTWRWRGTPPAALGVAAAPLADPAGATRVAVAAPGGTAVALSDRLGPIDTSRAVAGGLSVVIPAALKAIQASGARTDVADSLVLRPLLVLGTVSWEAKFVVRALEERGWTVDTRLYLGPGHFVIEGHNMPMDTSNYAAVIATDSGARSASAAIDRYAREGGGVIIAGSAGRVLGAIAPARLGAWRDAKPLSYFPLLGADPDSLIATKGNVVQIGYDDTWRLRMDSVHGPMRHRDWWAGVVAAAAYTPRITLATLLNQDPAPVAATIDRLGRPTPAGHETGGTGPEPWIWFAVIAAALLVEWTSRRLRGVP